MDQVITGLLGVLLSSCVPIAGAAYGIITAGISMAGAGTERPEIVTRLLLAVVLAEAIGIYGLLTSIMLIGKLSTILVSYEASMKGLTAGAVMAACGLMASIAIAYTGSAMAGAGVEKPEIVTRTLLAVVLAEALAIYGLLISIMLIGTI
jgi:V-type H+-transporting ATPase proteolipid subunit